METDDNLAAHRLELVFPALGIQPLRGNRLDVHVVPLSTKDEFTIELPSPQATVRELLRTPIKTMESPLRREW
jgi:hypothetical protein